MNSFPYAISFASRSGTHNIASRRCDSVFGNTWLVPARPVLFP